MLLSLVSLALRLSPIDFAVPSLLLISIHVQFLLGISLLLLSCFPYWFISKFELMEPKRLLGGSWVWLELKEGWDQRLQCQVFSNTVHFEFRVNWLLSWFCNLSSFSNIPMLSCICVYELELLIEILETCCLCLLQCLDWLFWPFAFQCMWYVTFVWFIHCHTRPELPGFVLAAFYLMSVNDMCMKWTVVSPLSGPQQTP